MPRKFSELKQQILANPDRVRKLDEQRKIMQITLSVEQYDDLIAMLDDTKGDFPYLRKFFVKELLSEKEETITRPCEISTECDGDPAKEKVDPYDYDINGVVVKRFICDRCYASRSDEI